MGFLKKSNAPSELPNLAIEGISEKVAPPVVSAPVAAQPLPVSEPVAAAPVVQPIVAVAAQPVIQPVAVSVPAVKKREVAGEDYLEVSHKEAVAESMHNDIKKVVEESLPEDSKFRKESFFDEVLEDINGGIADVGKLEDWYEKKFEGKDVVSNMKEYWEGNKADIIIESFGAEYKREINDKVKALRTLEEDWREIYFKLIKKEEEMKKEERELKDTLAEFVDLCKRRKHGGEEKAK